MDDQNEDTSLVVDCNVEALDGDIKVLELERKKSEEAAHQLREVLPKAEEVGELAAQDVKGYGKKVMVYICIHQYV